ncbi:Stk1 family PASTA domain-containing Ser/Thr kinase [Alloscardovia theropitheci]|uniref:non-specific serine/threonine protein kinase n=1 Tax=Alloscardovia theropitheci TaxID=2496842 RepID=A0A4R0QVR4_9BIFI|nr:Stk1 family PASTA domain-containing Ser/Thr kinase [Alloscardovia theropitheci]TCD54347.1 Stk1 family PASTA domain-containing Ser/Thr kinase [Alloscardovia theropitheci]
MSIFTPSTLSRGRYTVGELIGHGGMAEVRKGIDTRLGRTVAIKIMRSDLANDETFLKRFRLEARSIALLNNPNIVSIFDTDEEEITDPDTGRTVRLPYIVMEYVKGQTLRDILKVNGSLNQRDTSQIMLGMLNALEYSHRMGIIHRDIKPGNIMISEQGAVKVMDFGIARMLDDSAATLTQNQGVVGTAQYLSPEQARGEVVDTRSDLYSAGCVLYEMLTGRPPFTGDSAVAIAYQHVSESAPKPTDIIPALNPIWDAVCAKAMAKDRTQRYATAAQFRKDIATIAAGGTPVIEGVDTAALAGAAGIAGAAAGGAAAAAGATTGTDTETSATQTIPRTQSIPVDGTQSLDNIDFNDEGVANLANSTAQATPPSRSAQRQQALAQKQKKRKRIIIWSSIITAVIIIASIGGWWFMSRAQANATVPTITASMTQAQAKEAVEQAGFVFQAEVDSESSADAGTFTKQDPAGGSSAARGSTVHVWFSSGPQSVAVPDVSGMSQAEARAALEQAGFKVGSTSSEDSDSVDKDQVTRTDPASGSNAARGSTVKIFIASGNSSVPTGLTGQTQDAATKILTSHHFNVVVREGDYSDSVPAGSVASVEPGEGSSVSRGSTVTLVISKGARPTETVQLNPGLYVGRGYRDAVSLLTDRGFASIASQDGSTPSDNATVTHIYANGTEVTQTTDVPKDATITLSTR